MSHKPLHILLVDADEIDAEYVIRSFRKHQIGNPITHVSDGLEALHVLRGAANYPHVPRPYLILLDINMPRMNGVEFLQAMRQDPALKRSIVFVLTTSNRAEDKRAVYEQMIAGYILKEKVGEDFLEVIRLLGYYQIVVEVPE